MVLTVMMKISWYGCWSGDLTEVTQLDVDAYRVPPIWVTNNVIVDHEQCHAMWAYNHMYLKISIQAVCWYYH